MALPDITLQMAATLDRLLADGWELPIHFALVSVNGSVIGGLYERQDDGRIRPSLTTAPRGRFLLPINMMLVNRGTGAAVRVVFEHGAEPKFIQ